MKINESCKNYTYFINLLYSCIILVFCNGSKNQNFRVDDCSNMAYDLNSTDFTVTWCGMWEFSKS